MPFTVGQLIANKKPVTVFDTDSVRHALHLMTSNRFSQLPVINREGKALGMITNESILRALDTFGAAIDKMLVGDVMDKMRVLDAMDEVRRMYYEDESIFYLIEDLKETNAVLIVDKEQYLIGIVTHYDTTEYFRERAEDMMYAEEIEALLKEFFNAYFTTPAGLDVQARDQAVATMYSNKSFDELTQHNYIRLLLDESRWLKYSSIFSFDRDTVLKLLNDAKDTRNDAAHFHTDEITSEQRMRLKLCRDWLARHTAIVSSTFTGVVLEPDEQQNRDIQRTETPPSLVAFKEIEQIIGDELPASARLYRVWWSNNLKINPQARQWWEAGWRVSTIRMAEEVVVFTRVEGRKKAYIDFFSSLLEQLASYDAFPMRSLSPDGESWVSIASLPTNGKRVATLGFSFARRKRFRVELYIDTGDELENKEIFNKLLVHKGSIEDELGTSLSWERLEGVRASRIAFYHAGAIEDTEGDLAKLLHHPLYTSPSSNSNRTYGARTRCCAAS